METLRLTSASLALALLSACATSVDPTGGGGAGGAGTGAGGAGGTADTGGASTGGGSTGGADTGGAGASGTGGGASCEDAALNGDETDIDCGGSCPPCPSGSDCAVDADCATGFCADDEGVCCGTACDGACEACAAEKTGLTDGMCGPITAGTDPEAECAATPVAGCGVAGLGCDGAGACLLHPQGAECAAATCALGMATAASTCDGDGACLAGASTDCGNYACDPNTQGCKTSCATDADCETPAVCGPSMTCGGPAVVIDTHNLGGLTEYPLDTDTCGCCGATTTAETATALCVLAGFTTAITWSTGMISGTNCYCWDCITNDSWASNCCSGLTSRPMILTVTCQ